MNTPEESAFDEQLRRQLADFASPRPLPAGGMADVRARLAAAQPAAPRPGGPARPFLAGLAVGILLVLIGWWSIRPGDGPPPVRVAPPASSARAAGHPTVTLVAAAPVAVSAGTVAARSALRAEAPPKPTLLPSQSVGRPATPPAPVTTRAALPAPTPPLPVTPGLAGVVTAADSARPQPAEQAVVPAPHLLPARWVRAIALDTALHRALAQPLADTSRAAQAAHRAHLQTLLAQQTAALAALQGALDSLKAALPEAPPALAVAPLPAPADSLPPAAAPEAWRHLPPVRSPWALLVQLETTPSWSTLPVRNPSDDNERTQASLSQSLQVQRQVARRWLVRAGLGQLTTQSQVRRTTERSGQRVVRDSTLTTELAVRFSVSTVQIVRFDSVLHVEPIINLGGQIVRYDTTWLPKVDTLLVPIINRDTLRTSRKVVTTRTENWREQRQQLFRPQYHFWTLPVSLQYQMLRTNRWTVGLNLGGQLTIFRGGARPVWTGDDYVMQRVSPREGPYRPVSLSASGGLEVAYRLAPRLSALVAPTARWWVVQPGRTGYTTQALLPALQLGLTYGF